MRLTDLSSTASYLKNRRIGDEKLEHLRKQSAEALFVFLRADLDFGFTLVGVAKTELQIGDFEGFKEAKQRAGTAVQTVEYFKARLPQGNKREIEKRLAELKGLISTL